MDFTGVVHIPSPGPGIDERWSKQPTWNVQQEVVITAPTDITWQLTPTKYEILGDFEYWIWVILADAAGTHLMPQFHLDPDITNKGAGGRFTITHTAS